MLRARSTTPVLAALAASALLLAGCGSDGDSSASAPTSSAKASSTAKPLTAAQLEKALLTATDVPAGYKADAADDYPETDEDTGCAKLDALTKRTADSPRAERSFSKGDSSADPVISATLESLAGGSAEFAEAKAAFESCPTITTDDGSGTEIPLKVTVVPVDGIGDQAFGIRATGTYQGVPITRSSAFVLVGSTLVEIDIDGLGDIDQAQAVTLAKTALAKFESAQA